MMMDRGKKLSKGLLELKFMKRSKDKAECQEEDEERQDLYQDQLAKLHEGADRVIMINSYYDCMNFLPCRLSFGGADTEIEKLNEDKLTGIYRVEKKRKEYSTGMEVDISAEEFKSGPEDYSSQEDRFLGDKSWTSDINRGRRGDHRGGGNRGGRDHRGGRIRGGIGDRSSGGGGGSRGGSGDRRGGGNRARGRGGDRRGGDRRGGGNRGRGRGRGGDHRGGDRGRGGDHRGGDNRGRGEDHRDGGNRGRGGGEDHRDGGNRGRGGGEDHGGGNRGRGEDRGVSKKGCGPNRFDESNFGKFYKHEIMAIKKGPLKNINRHKKRESDETDRQSKFLKPNEGDGFISS